MLERILANQEKMEEQQTRILDNLDKMQVQICSLQKGQLAIKNSLNVGRYKALSISRGNAI